MEAPCTTPGCPHPLGAQLLPGGANFSVYASDAERVELLLYDHADDAQPARVVDLAAPGHRTWHYWHAFVPGARAGQLYAFRAHGPWDPGRGLRHDGDKVLLDPYARAVVVPRDWRRGAACVRGRNDAQALKGVVADLGAYDWEGDRPLRRPFAETVILELHLRGYTRHPSSGLPEALRGTYHGLIEKIPTLVELGITAVELMPVFQFDPQDAPPGLVNHWGYAPLSFFAPHAPYAAAAQPLAVLDEFRDLVKALHRAGLELILDVVYNHSAEAGALGPTISLRGLDNATYYLLDEQGAYRDFSGCGNTLNSSHAVVRRMILDSLRHWVEAMHVDGFRFDLASILSRDEHGHPHSGTPVLWDIESDPVLAGTKLIAEAWDAGGLYQVGHFVGERWKTWNGRFRDDVRAFVRGDPGLGARVAGHLLGGADAAPAAPGLPSNPADGTVDFVTSHDGFTLSDLVSYERKHNESNREGNRDGSDANFSMNGGVEGPTSEPAVQAWRARQARNLLALTLLSAGTPMLLMGDDGGRTQHGNNNAYCHDDETSWLDWSLAAAHGDLRRFVRALIRLRQAWRRGWCGEAVGPVIGPGDAGGPAPAGRWVSEDGRAFVTWRRHPAAPRWLVLCAQAGDEAAELPWPGAAALGEAVQWRCAVDTAQAPGSEVSWPPAGAAEAADAPAWPIGTEGGDAEGPGTRRVAARSVQVWLGHARRGGEPARGA
jgi:isoamylase